MTTATAVYPTLEERPLKDTIVLFDVDETLSKARRVCYDDRLPPESEPGLICLSLLLVCHSGDA